MTFKRGLPGPGLFVVLFMVLSFGGEGMSIILDGGEIISTMFAAEPKKPANGLRALYRQQAAQAREDDDEKHVHPLQLDVIDRIVELYSNPGETVLTPFMGVGSEVYSPVSMGRKAIGIELKDSYYKQAIRNLATVGSRFVGEREAQLFDEQVEDELMETEQESE